MFKLNRNVHAYFAPTVFGSPKHFAQGQFNKSSTDGDGLINQWTELNRSMK